MSKKLVVLEQTRVGVGKEIIAMINCSSVDALTNKRAMANIYSLYRRIHSEFKGFLYELSFELKEEEEIAIVNMNKMLKDEELIKTYENLDDFIKDYSKRVKEVTANLASRRSIRDSAIEYRKNR